MTGPRREDDPLPAGEPQESPVPEANVVRIEDEIDAPAALLTWMRHAVAASMAAPKPLRLRRAAAP